MVTSVGQPADKVVFLLQMSVRMTLAMPSRTILNRPENVTVQLTQDYMVNQVIRPEFSSFVVAHGTQMADGQ